MQIVETRWLAIVQDGRHTTLGRHRDPEPETLTSTGSLMDSQGLVGWLAVIKGDYWSRDKEPEVLMVRRLSTADGDWEAALTAWREARREAVKDG